MSIASPRIVSLLPSATEIVAALGFGENLVGRSHECDFPAGVEQLPVCSSSRISTVGTSRDIDQRVKALVSEGISMYEVDAELLRRLKPDFVLTQTQCAVCAVTPDDLKEALSGWHGSDTATLSLEPNNLADVWQDIRGVGESLGVPDVARSLADSLVERLDKIRNKTAPLSKPTVAALEWTSPLMAGGNWMPELIEAAGGQSLLAESGAHSPEIDWETLIASDPDVIMLMPCGFRLARSREDIEILRKNPHWNSMKAVRNGQVYIIDGHHYFNRPGPRLVESAEIVAEILHPEHFDFGHHCAAWVRANEA